MLSLLISGPMQAVEDKRKLEKHMGSKKLNAVDVLGCRSEEHTSELQSH